MLGCVIDGYAVIAARGGGARGAFYEVSHDEQGRGLLFLAATPAPLSKGAIARLKRVGHRNLGKVLGSGTFVPTGAPYLVFEMPDGESVEDRLARSGPIGPKGALAVLGQAAAGLSALHQAGLCHGNLGLCAVYLVCDGAATSVKLIGMLPPQEDDAVEVGMPEDLDRLKQLFLALAGSGASPEQIALRRQLMQIDPARSKNPLAIYASIEAAVRRCAPPLEEDDSALLEVPGSPEDESTVELPRLETADILQALPAASLLGVAGPHERPRAGGRVRLLEVDTPLSPLRHRSAQKDEVTTTIRRSGWLDGPARWLWPLGLLALLALGLAAWSLSRR